MARNYLFARQILWFVSGFWFSPFHFLSFFSVCFSHLDCLDISIKVLKNQQICSVFKEYFLQHLTYYVPVLKFYSKCCVFYNVCMISSHFSIKKSPFLANNYFSIMTWWSCRILPPGPKYHMDTILRAQFSVLFWQILLAAENETNKCRGYFFESFIAAQMTLFSLYDNPYSTKP